MTNISDLPKQCLTITVWHHDKENQPEYIGQYIVRILTNTVPVYRFREKNRFFFKREQINFFSLRFSPRKFLATKFAKILKRTMRDVVAILEMWWLIGSALDY